MCARGAASPAAQIPPSAELRHLVVCRIRSGPVPAGDSFQHQGCQAATIPSRACPDTSSLMSSTQLRSVAESLSPCPCCVCSGQARDEAVRAASGFLSHPPSLACVLFPGLVWGVTALHKIRSYNNYNTYRQPAFWFIGARCLSITGSAPGGLGEAKSKQSKN